MKKRTKLLTIFVLFIVTIAVCLLPSYLTDSDSAESPEATLSDESAADSAFDETAYAVTFSVPGGFFQEDFYLELSAPDGFDIYYTLDGSTPTDQSTRYTEPLLISDVSDSPNKYCIREDFSPFGSGFENELQLKATVIRAIAVCNGISTDVSSATYFVHTASVIPDTYRIVSLITDPENMFSEDTGIYVLGKNYADTVAAGGDPWNDNSANYRQSGYEWEREVHLDYFDSSLDYTFSQELGIRINGASSRSDSRKSLRLYARKKYDFSASAFRYAFFDPGIYPKSILLRRGSIVSQFLSSLVSDRTEIGILDYEPCIVFLNGEYWGKYYLQERCSADYVQNHYGVPADNISVIKDGDLLDGSGLVYHEFQELRDYITSNDLSIQKNYDYVCSQIDMQSFITFYCTQIYVNNYDFSESKNSVFWRSNVSDPSFPYADTKWRWILMDLDYTMTTYGDAESYQTNSFRDHPPNAVVTQIEEPLFSSFLANDRFREQFVTTFLDLENENFRYSDVKEKIDDVAIYGDVNETWYEFFEKRPEYINAFLAEEFGLTGNACQLSLSLSGLTDNYQAIHLNQIDPSFSDSMAWSGIYYTDYPVTLTAKEDENRSFIKWIVNGKDYSTSPSITLPLSGTSMRVEAVFEER